MRRALVCIATLLAAFVPGSTGLAHASGRSPSAEQPRLITTTIPDAQGYLPSKWLPYPGEPRAAVLLPSGYDPHRRYPLVLNLGGLGGDYAKAAFGPSIHVRAIVVTPEPYDGWYDDWWNDGERGGPAWESYFLNDVVPWIPRHYPIRPGRRWHAVVGISMGGLGAAYLGGRLPGYFGTVASLSGFLDPQYFGAITQEGMGIVSAAPLHGDHASYPVLGPPNGFYATGHNPTRLVQNLAYTHVFESTGTGVPSKAGIDQDLADAVAGSGLEGPIIYPMNQLFHRAAVDAGVDVTYDAQSGGHDGPDFSKEISAMFSWGLFKPVTNHPQSWTNQTVATSGQLWNIGYAFDHPPTSLVRFTSSYGLLTVSGAGSAVTITAGDCRVHATTPARIDLAGRDCLVTS
ncbi:MAG TPA: alpha/beta hydrolase-fold protein [Mycobacteriales bacterium]|jgi:S-formylglutathione hydrolase FrmB|nr:alpha/beta hydrolase-fold protein [Mycobacteriales bacterium]